MRPVLIWGRHGLLAGALRRIFAQEWPLQLWGRAELPGTRADQIRKVLRLNPSAIVNASGFTHLRQAQKAPWMAWELHVLTPAFLAALTRKLGIPFITLSSDYVFSGEGKTAWKEWDGAEPINAYGKSKWAGEQAVRAVNPRAKIIRTAGVFGPATGGGKVSFPEKILQQVRGGLTPEVRSDLTTSLCHVDDLARDLWKILWGSSTGTFHVVHAGGATWLQIAEATLLVAGLPPSLKSTRVPDFPRPPCSTLDTQRTESRFGQAHRKSWREGLENFVRSLPSDPS